MWGLVAEILLLGKDLGSTFGSEIEHKVVDLVVDLL